MIQLNLRNFLGQFFFCSSRLRGTKKHWTAFYLLRTIQIMTFSYLILNYPYLWIFKVIRSLYPKDAGFVYESLRNETNRVILKKNFHETNPRNESFNKISTNPNHDTGNL
jgi:hypothetical protein